MKKYFVAREGIQKGPWELQEITQNIQKKVLSWNDYIYDEKTGDWLFLFEFPLLTAQFNQSFKKPVKSQKSKARYDILRDRVWYILKVEEYYGPFSSSEMVQMLQSKTLFEHDFIWKLDQPSWKRLADVDEFKPDSIKALYESTLKDPTEVNLSFFRRRYSRAQYSCELLIHNNHEVFSAESLEISAGGACFKTDEVKFKLDDYVYLHFKPGRDVPAFNATCKVVSVNKNKFGVSFVNVSSTVKELITKYTSKKAA